MNGLKDFYNIDLVSLKSFRAKTYNKKTGKSWLQKDLAEEAGISQAYMARIERGDIKSPNHKYVEAMAAAMEVNVSHLLKSLGKRDLSLQSHSMDDDTLTKHRAFIAIKAQALMGRFFQLPQDDLVKRDILLGWMDMLQDFTAEEITKACSQYLIEYPSKRPHEGLVRQIVINNRKRYIEAQPRIQIEAAPRKSQDAEERKRISQEMMAKLGKKW